MKRNAYGRRLIAGLAAVFLGFGFAADFARGQTEYPTRTVRIVVPFPPGGGNDITARLLAQRLQAELGQPFVVENKPGADGILAFEFVKRAPPDGYTLLLGQSTGMTVNPAVYKRLPYDPLADFAPISTVGLFPLVLVVNAKSDVETLAGLVTQAKAKPGQINVGYPTMSYRLAMSMVGREMGFTFNAVAYRGSAPTLNGLLTREVDAGLIDLAAVKNQIDAGALRALAVASPAGKDFLPGVPTLEEVGAKGVVLEFWSGLFAPSGTPQDIVEKLRSHILKFLETDELKRQAALLAMKPFATTPDELRKMIRDQGAVFKKIAKEENISVD